MTKLRVLASTSLVATLTALLSSCTAKTTDRFEGEARSLSVDFTAGADLHISSRNGVINIESGGTDEIVVDFEPFTYRGYDEEDEARDEMENSLVTVLEQSEDGSRIDVETRKEGSGSSSLGADITLRLPASFDGGIFIEQGNGDVDINTVGEAHTVVVRNGGVGDCFVDGAPSVTFTEVWCSGVSVKDVSDYVNVQADGLGGNIYLKLAGISGTMPAGEVANRIYTEDGDVVLELPSSDDFVVQARSFAPGGAINVGEVPAGCDSVTSSDADKTVTCGTGPTFDLQAGLDGDQGNIELRYF